MRREKKAEGDKGKSKTPKKQCYNVTNDMQ